MSNFNLLLIASIILIIIAYFWGVNTGYDDALDDVIEYFNEEIARDLQNIKEGNHDDSKRKID